MGWHWQVGDKEDRGRFFAVEVPQTNYLDEQRCCTVLIHTKIKTKYAISNARMSVTFSGFEPFVRLRTHEHQSLKIRFIQRYFDNDDVFFFLLPPLAAC